MSRLEVGTVLACNKAREYCHRLYCVSQEAAKRGLWVWVCGDLTTQPLLTGPQQTATKCSLCGRAPHPDVAISRYGITLPASPHTSAQALVEKPIYLIKPSDLPCTRVEVVNVWALSQ